MQADQANQPITGRRRTLKTTFRTQAKALLRKNLQQQRRAWCTNLFIVITPIFFCVLLYVLQRVINNAIDKPDNRCGCLCLYCCPSGSSDESVCHYNTPDNPCNSWDDCKQYSDNPEECGFAFSDAEQASYCAVPSPSIWPALFSVPGPGYNAKPWAPDAAMLITGQNRALVESLQMFSDPNVTETEQQEAANFTAQGQETGALYAGSLSLLGLTLGSSQKSNFYSYFVEPAFIPTEDYDGNITVLVGDSTSPESVAAVGTVNATVTALTSNAALDAVNIYFTAEGTKQVWMPSAEDVDRVLYCGYRDARCNGTSETNGIVGAWDFGATDPSKGQFSVRVWFNSTKRYGRNGGQPPNVVRVHAPLNVATNAFLEKALQGVVAGASALARLVGVMEMPKPSTQLSLDIASLVGTLFYTWLLQLLLPVMLATLVAEKENRLRTMMKMHGLGDAAYWAIQYVWYFVVNMIYVWILIGFGSLIDLAFFTRTSYSFQFVFYLLWVACLISFTFLLSAVFRSARTSVVVAFLYVFATGLIGFLLLQEFVAAGNWWAVFFNIVPGFALYRGLFEISQYAFRAAYQGGEGISWSSLSEDGNGLPAVMAFFAAEAVLFLILAWYLEKVLPGGVGVPSHPLFFLGKKFKSELHTGSSQKVEVKTTSNGVAERGGRAGEKESTKAWWKFWGKKSVSTGTAASATVAPVDALALSVEPEDVAAERQRVSELLQAATTTTAASQSPQPQINLADSETSILVQDLRKVFPGKVKKIAVQDLALAVSRGEVFGLLGPNGAGKSTTLNILTGFLTPSAGTALVEGYDIRTEMEHVYGIMGVCPQDNLLWDRLTAREHLSFYGRLKGLTGDELRSAVEASARSVNLYNGGVIDKQIRAFSGGMKRRLSVAISLIGDPQVVYMDEPSTGLDPSSRQNLWSVVKAAKADRGIILTTHSMEEAAALCDRLGIFVDGQLVCIGAPKELTARYGGYLVVSVTTPPGEERAVDALVRKLSPSAKLTYSVGSTMRYEVPTSQVSLSAVFAAMEEAIHNREIKVLDWGVANATLEEVFIKFARSIGAQGGN